MLEQLIEAGMDVARLNFSHGSHADHQRTFRHVREAAAKMGTHVTILQDLQGPKIRVGTLQGDIMELTDGQQVVIVAADEQTGPNIIPTTYDAIARDVSVGDTVLMDDGLLRLKVEQVDDEGVKCLVEVGGTLKNRKGINLPGVDVSAPALTEKDLEDLDYGISLGVDVVCLSFVRSPADIELAKERMRAAGRVVPIVAKIEKPEAVECLPAILDCVEGIMVARGDLGVEMGPEKVPLIQKRCIEEANKRGQLVITATQMLESMVTSTFPTRAEASDVANAVLDQSDAVMLSAETATGDHPALVVSTMARIIREIEGSERYRKAAQLPPLELGVVGNALACAATAAAESLPLVRGIVCISSHGIAPTLVSDYRPHVPILALTRRQPDCDLLGAYWGVKPVHFPYERGETVEAVIARADAMLVERGLLSAGDQVILTLAVPPTTEEHTNTLKVHVVGDPSN